MSQIINLNLEKILLSLGAVRTLRAFHYKGLIIHENFLDSQENLVQFCSSIAFDNKKELTKRKEALKLSTYLLNYSK